MADRVAAAIAAPQAQPPDRRVGANVPLLNNPERVVRILDVPIDISDLEALALIAAILSMTDQLRAAREAQKGPQLLVTHGQLPRA